MDNKGKEAGFTLILVVMFASIAIASFWDSIPLIKNSVHSVLDPSLGALLNWEVAYGMTLIVLVLSLLTTLIQKYATDQETLKELRDEQKKLQEEMKKYKDNPGKLMELQKKQLEFIPKTMKISMRSIVFTSVPLILLFRWFMDVFTTLGNPKLFTIFNWFWFYLIASIVFSSVFRKVLKVV